MISVEAHDALRATVPVLKKLVASETQPAGVRLEAARVLLAIRDGLPALATAERA